MEIGVGLTFSVPARSWDSDPDAEHTSLMRDMGYLIEADRLGFKYGLVAEHHFLHEYSHTAAPEVELGYLAHATKRIHLMSGIFNPLPTVNHPVKVAEKVAMLDHLTEGRFEFGTGRGAGSYEILGFLPGTEHMDTTKLIWDDVIDEIPKMWSQEVYPGYQSQYWSIPARPVVPKPWRHGHPALWYAAANPTSWAMAARKGMGVIGFSLDSLEAAEKAVAVYKNEVRNAEPIGAYVNDYLLAVCQMSVSEDRERAIDWVCSEENAYYQSLVFRYHDTFPRPQAIPAWPELLPPLSREAVPFLQQRGAVIGDPDDAMAVLKRWESIGVDGVIFGVGPLGHAHAEETLRCVGTYLLPTLDPDPLHRTTRFRDQLQGQPSATGAARVASLPELPNQ